VLFASKDVAPAFAASERAIALNKYDTAVLGDYGGRLIAAGEVERGLNVLRRAAGAGVVLPSSQHFYLFLGNYLQGDMSVAAYQASQITGERQPLGLLARALSAYASKETERARQALDALVALQPAWRDDTRGQLAKFFTDPTIIDRLARDLSAAGLSSHSSKG
jgi:Tfp pilus assembly protein PilF